jgi:hypothetical protein
VCGETIRRREEDWVVGGLCSVLHRRQARPSAIILLGLASPAGGMDIYDVEYELPGVWWLDRSMSGENRGLVIR